MGNLDVLDPGSNNDKQALVDLQLSLAAYTQIVVKNLCDSIPKLVYAQLITKVNCIHAQTASTHAHTASRSQLRCCMCAFESSLCIASVMHHMSGTYIRTCVLHKHACTHVVHCHHTYHIVPCVTALCLLRMCVLQITKCLSSTIRDGLRSNTGGSLLDLMHDPQRVYMYKQLQETVENLKKANATLRRL